ncbi:MAG: N(G),N(G)-dimethylarginine dimethylaminohydrolase, partial [Gammaproteobacteria bacterium]|nr:N(G),N(G)-dimethylarginine dimethylaminohydrolase [Gammaproteobacteria bacterium]
CQAGSHVFVGISARTNPEGARQFCEIMRRAGHSASTVDIRANPALLHLKSGIAHLGDARLLIAPGLPVCEHMAKFEILRVCAAESYAANCVRINDRLLIAAGYPLTAAMLRARGYDTLPLDVSEFRKMDGGLSCLSLRFEV